jgi:hypothetical protein
MRHVAEHGDAEVERAARRIAADERAVVTFREREEAVAKCFEPRFIGARQRERERECVRLRAHRGEVRQIHRERLVAERVWIDIGEEVAAFDQHVRRNGELMAGGRRDERAVVADAERRRGLVVMTWRGRRRAACEESVDQ